MESEIIFQPIGIYKTENPAQEPYQVPRQPDESERKGHIEFFSGHEYEKALQDLNGFERVWLIYHFHKNPNWKPLILPPRGTDTKKGVFATRAPYRPNAIGMSCVRLLKTARLSIEVVGADLLEDTPILDIKPYIPEVDSFPASNTGWLTKVEDSKFQVNWSPDLAPTLSWLRESHLQELIDFAERQLAYEPFDSRRKRVQPHEDDWILSYRTWRIYWKQSSEKQILILRVTSGYSADELANSEDPYLDKALHRYFLQKFGPK